jgi:hypothetical protein
MEIEFPTTPTFPDYVRFKRHLMFGPFLVLSILSAMFLAVFLLSPLLPGDPAKPPPPRRETYRKFSVLAIPAALTFVGIPVLSRLRWRKQWARDRALSERRTYRFSDDGFSVEGETIESPPRGSEWKRISRAKVSGDVLMLFTSGDWAFVVPLRDVPPDQRDAFVDLVRRRVPRVRGL